MSNITPEFNKYPKIANFDEVIFIAQQAYELGFRGGTGRELYNWLQTRLDLTGLSNTAGLPEDFPEPNTQLTASNKGEWTILTPGTYQKQTTGEIVVPQNQFAFAQFDGTDYNVVKFVEMPDPQIDEWDSSKIYNKYEVVTFNGGIFRSKINQSIGGIRPDNLNYYEMIVPAGLEDISTGYFTQSGGIRKADGSDILAGELVRTDYIRIVNGLTYSFVGTEGNTSCAAYFYDYSFRPIAALANPVQDRVDVVIDNDNAPMEAVYFRAVKHVKYPDSIIITGAYKYLLNNFWEEDIFSYLGEGIDRYGEVFENNDVKRTDYITIDDNIVLQATVYHGVLATAVYFYDLNKRPISYLEVVSGPSICLIDNKNIPAKAAYVIFTCNNRTSFVKKTQPTNSTINNIRQLKLSNIVDVFVYDGEGVRKSNGMFIQSETTVRTGFLHLDNIRAIRGFEGSTVAMLYFYSSAYFPIKSLEIDLGDNEYYIKDEDIPNGAKYAVITARKNDILKYVEVKDKSKKIEADFLPVFNNLSSASVYETILRNATISQGELMMQIIKESYTPKWYGVSWLEDSDPNNVTRIGDLSLHSSLPIQNKMRRCVVKNGIVKYYLHEDDSTLIEDNTTAVLDGSDGDVMVEIPEFYFKFEKSGSICELKISEEAIPGYRYSAKRYTSAFEASVNNEKDCLNSVVTTLYGFEQKEIFIQNENTYIQSNAGYSLGLKKTAIITGYTSNAEVFRGGDNNESYDNILSYDNQGVTLNCLGRPRSNINKRQARILAENKKDGATMYLYDTHKALYILSLVEFANRDFQSTALGKGATVFPNYDAANNYYGRMRAIIPTGVTLKLGNNSGEVYYDMRMAPNNSSASEFVNVWMPVMSYRGVENFYGHQYKIVDQVKVKQLNLSSTSINNTISKIDYLYQRNPYLTDNEYQNSVENIGSYVFNPYIKVISEIVGGDDFHILPANTSTTSHNTQYADCCEIKSNQSDFHTVFEKEVSFSGRYVSKTLCGPLFICSESKEALQSKEHSRECNVTRFDYIAFD